MRDHGQGISALPNNRVRVTHPAWFETGEGAPDSLGRHNVHYSKSDLDYTLDVNRVFDNLYAGTGHDEENARMYGGGGKMKSKMQSKMMPGMKPGGATNDKLEMVAKGDKMVPKFADGRTE